MSKTFRIVTNILMIVMAFFIIIFTFAGIAQVAEGLDSYAPSEDSMLYTLEDGRYADLIRYYHRNAAVETDATETMEECYAIARYYEAAVDYKLAEQENNSQGMEEAKERMEEEISGMGALSFAEKEINEILEIR